MNLEQISINSDRVFNFSPAETRAVEKLVTLSNEKCLSLTSVIDHNTTINKNMLPKKENCAWFYGTKYWDMLTKEQKKEVLWAEVARDVSMFIFLEQTLPPLYVGFVNRYREGFTKEIYEYFMIFAKEEIVHTLIFRKWLALTHEKVWPAPSSNYTGLLQKLPVLHPVIGVLWTLTIEWAAETNAIFTTQGPEVEPVTARMFFEHHKEEVRHITFGRKVINNWFSNASEDEKELVRNTFSGQLSALMSLITYNNDLQKMLSFKLPFDENDEQVVKEIRTSENNRKINAQRFAEQMEWYKQLGIAH